MYFDVNRQRYLRNYKNIESFMFALDNYGFDTSIEWVNKLDIFPFKKY